LKNNLGGGAPKKGILGKGFYFKKRGGRLAPTIGLFRALGELRLRGREEEAVGNARARPSLGG